MTTEEILSWKFCPQQHSGWFRDSFRRWRGTQTRAITVACRLARLTNTRHQIVGDHLSPSGVILCTPSLRLGYADPDGSFLSDEDATG